jgi:hypothetical protein
MLNSKKAYELELGLIFTGISLRWHEEEPHEYSFSSVRDTAIELWEEYSENEHKNVFSLEWVNK